MLLQDSETPVDHINPVFFQTIFPLPYNSFNQYCQTSAQLQKHKEEQLLSVYYHIRIKFLKITVSGDLRLIQMDPPDPKLHSVR